MHHNFSQFTFQASDLAKQKRKVKPIIGDGNCLFRALGLIVYKSEFTHQHIRQLLANFLSENKACFQKYCRKGLSIEEHIGRMRYDRCWGTAIEILATASLLQMVCMRCWFYEGVLPVLANDAVVMVAASVH